MSDSYAKNKSRPLDNIPIFSCVYPTVTKRISANSRITYTNQEISKYIGINHQFFPLAKILGFFSFYSLLFFFILVVVFNLCEYIYTHPFGCVYIYMYICTYLFIYLYTVYIITSKRNSWISKFNTW